MYSNVWSFHISIYLPKRIQQNPPWNKQQKHLKMDGWEPTSFPFGMAYSQAALLPHLLHKLWDFIAWPINGDASAALNVLSPSVAERR